MAESQSTNPVAPGQRKKHFSRLRRRDHTGQRFGKLVAMRFSRISDSKKTYWWFRCDCGKEIEARIDQAGSKNTQSCGCIKAEVAKGLVPTRKGKRRAPVTDLAGQRFARLLVVSESPKRDGSRARRWHCVCDCGAEATVEQRNLVAGVTRSCGCLQKMAAVAQAVAMGRANAVHGMTDTPEWLAWKNMISRCEDPGQESYPQYGGRGITVCGRWREFANFYADMGPRPSPTHSLDRFPDKSGNYEPSNCRWATIKEQQRNRRSNRPITCNGETRLLTEWAEMVGMTRSRLARRLEYGWPAELAIFTPLGVVPDDLEERRLPVDPLVRLKAYARAAVYVAIKEGRLVRPMVCQYPGCDNADVQAHHHKGYQKENFLDVVWLCRSHHEDAEKEMA